jgi:hypothetical protein
MMVLVNDGTERGLSMSQTATLTREAATTFARESTSNAVLLKSILTCACNPYQDVFTFNRWKAQNMCVNKGSHGIHLPLVKVIDETDANGNKTQTRKVLGQSVVFCRCQVHPFGQKSEPEPIKPESRSESKPVYVKTEPKLNPIIEDGIMKGWRIIS